MRVSGALIARARGWIPEGRFARGRRGMVVDIVARVHLGLMLMNAVLPTGLDSTRAVLNLD